jgi:hypothetical protein
LLYHLSGRKVSNDRAPKPEELQKLIRAWGMDPEQILTQQALTRPHRTMIAPGYEENQVQTLSNAFKEMMRKELLLSQNGKG